MHALRMSRYSISCKKNRTKSIYIFSEFYGTDSDFDFSALILAGPQKWRRERKARARKLVSVYQRN